MGVTKKYKVWVNDVENEPTVKTINLRVLINFYDNYMCIWLN